MTALRERMIEDMQLRGFSARTQECYVAPVRQLAAHYHKSLAFLVSVDALSLIFRAKVHAALKKAGLLKQVPPKLWNKNWVEPCQHAGYGHKILDCLARYVFRVAITNSRLEKNRGGRSPLPVSRQWQPTDVPGDSGWRGVYPHPKREPPP